MNSSDLPLVRCRGMCAFLQGGPGAVQHHPVMYVGKLPSEIHQPWGPQVSSVVWGAGTQLQGGLLPFWRSLQPGRQKQNRISGALQQQLLATLKGLAALQDSSSV